MTAKIPAKNVKLKRAYDPPASTDGSRILVDRLWPRGISKEKASLDLWMKEIAPSTKIRKWFLGTIPLVGMNFADVTPRRCRRTPRSSINCAHLLDVVRPRSFSRRMMSFTTMQSCSEI